MNLECRLELGSAYKARSQIARVISEEWCAREFYCPACESNHLSRSKTNTPAIDFICPECDQRFQLKSLGNWNARKIVDAGYDAMIRAIRADTTPNLLVLQYSADWFVRNLLLIPRVFFSESVLEKRAPLSPQARRAGWVGCNILLSEIPQDGQIAVVSAGLVKPQYEVRREFARVRRLAEVPPSLRGWALDVLHEIRRLGNNQFTLQYLYRVESTLRALHPKNKHVRPKIRQQLQVLRDLGLIGFTSPGRYSLQE